MVRRQVLTGVLALVWAFGCDSGPPPPGPRRGDVQEPPAPQIHAAAPLDGATEVSRMPRFHWRLPDGLGGLGLVSFRLDEIAGPDRPAPEVEGREIAYCSGLHDTSPTELDIFNPPPNAILTWYVKHEDGLKPLTWYRWTVRAMGSRDGARASFVFRTQAALPPEMPKPEFRSPNDE